MSGLGLCRNCGAIVHWYQRSAGATHPPLKKDPITHYTVSEQMVAQRTTFTLHFCGPLERRAYSAHQRFLPPRVEPQSAAAKRYEVLRAWFVQVQIDLAEMTQDCPECHVRSGMPCERIDWAMGRPELNRFKKTPHDPRLNAVDIALTPEWESARSFRYLVASTGAEELYTWADSGPSLRPAR